MNCTEFIDTLRAEYKIIQKLSDKNGGMVVRMRNLTLSKDIILKKYERPVFAYELLKNIKHENLPEVYDTFMLDDGQIVLEEYINGVTVADVLETGKYTYGGAKAVMYGVCNAVETLHSFGMIHRDIKPENVMIDTKGKVKLIDLNASRQYGEHKTSDTVILGTLGYASPEQLGISQSDTRSDIYALGVLLNVMLTGEHPSSKLADGRAGKIVLKCTQIDPNSRFSTVEKLMEAL